MSSAKKTVPPGIFNAARGAFHRTMKCWTFCTSRSERPCTTGLIVSGGPEPTSANATKIHQTYKDALNASCDARGKVGFLNRQSPWSIFQINKEGEAAEAACGHAVAAMAAVWKQDLQETSSRCSILLPDSQAAVAFAVGSWDPAPVYQEWRVEGLQVEDCSTPTLKVARTRGMNDYWIFADASDQEITAFLAPMANSCTTRAAIVDCTETGVSVRFLTCGGSVKHGGVPLTGLANVSIAASRLAWLADLFSTGGFQSPLGFQSLLEVNNGIFNLPPVNVEFTLLPQLKGSF